MLLRTRSSGLCCLKHSVWFCVCRKNIKVNSESKASKHHPQDLTGRLDPSSQVRPLHPFSSYRSSTQMWRMKLAPTLKRFSNSSTDTQRWVSTRNRALVPAARLDTNMYCCNETHGSNRALQLAARANR